MTDSRFPAVLDDDTTIARVDDNISEIGGDAINSLRSAVFNIEETLGINPQGTAADVSTRLGRSLNSDGTIKASALAAIGLVTLPIVNSMIATNAGIEELKLDLNYGTSWLKERYDEIYALIISTMDALAIDIGHLTAHVSHPSTYGRHRTSDIDGYAGATYDGYNLQGIVDDLNTRIINHITDAVAAHAASAISFDDTDSPITAGNVQDAIRETSLYIEGATIRHQDRQHSNGILQEQDVVYDDTSHSYPLVNFSSISAVSAGDTFIIFSSAPSNFSEITRGDRVDILISGNIYIRYVDSITIATSVINFLIPLTVSGTGTAAVYKKSEEYSAPSSLNIAIRKTDISSDGGSIIQIVHPSSPFILSSNISPRSLTSSIKNIKLGWASGNSTPDIDVYSLLVAFSALSSTWTVENLSLVLNQEFANNHYPFISFVYGKELGIAFDEPNGYMVIDTPSSNSAWTTLGFSTGDIGYSLERKFYIDGYGFSELKKIVDASGTVLGGSPKTIQSITQDVLASGLQAPGILRIKNTVADDGTYVFDQINTSTSINVESNLTPINPLDFVVYADTFVVDSLSDQTLFELYLEGDNSTSAQFVGSARLQYYKEPTYSSQDATLFFNVVDVSRNFSVSSVRLAYIISSGDYLVCLGSRGAGGAVTNGGAYVNLPAPSSLIPGYRFKVFMINGIDYIEFEVIQDYSILATANSIDIDVYDRPSEERFLQIGKVLHNKQYFKYLEDRRLFGNVGRYDVRTDYTRDYTTYPRSLLRTGGVIRDCSITYTISATSFYYNGGQLLVNGMILDSLGSTFVIPNDGATSYNLYADGSGSVKFLRDNSYISGKISTPSSLEILESSDKTLLYIITTNSSNEIVSVLDVRKFVSHTDSKIELIVENQNYFEGKDLFYGNFYNLKSAVNYINSIGLSSSVSKKIAITGSLYLDSHVTLPQGTILSGNGTNSMIIPTTSDGYVFGSSDCKIENITFYNATTSPLGGFLQFYDAYNISIENCNFSLNTYGASTIGIKTQSASNVSIKNCSFTNLMVAIYGTVATTTYNENYYISENIFTNIRRYALYLYGLKTNTKNIYFYNNIIDTAHLDSANLINFYQVDSLYIEKNIINCSETAAASGAAIYISNSGTNVNILDNVITNTSVSNQGLQYGIYLIGGGVSPNDFNLSTICNNKIYYFFGGSSTGLSLVRATDVIIDSNEIAACRTALNIYDGLSLRITNNYLSCGFGAITASAPALAIGGSAPYIEGNLIISHNTFYHLVVDPSLVTSSVLVNITANGGFGNLINNNMFIVRSMSPYAVIIGNHNILSVASGLCTISGNHFNACEFFTLSWYVNYTVPIIYVTGDYCFVTNNNLYNTVCTVAKNSVTGTASTDYMNKGGTYDVTIPISYAKEQRDNAGISSWIYTGSAFLATDATYNASYTSVGCNFGNDFVPHGAEITHIEVLYSINTGAVGDLTLGWVLYSGFPSSITVIMSPTSVSSTGAEQVETLTPATTLIMGFQNIHKIIADATNISGTWNINILEINVTYIL